MKSAKNKKTVANILNIKKIFARRRTRIIAYILAILLALVITGYILDNFVFQPIKNPVFGVSFSKKRALELGVDWKANFLALLDDLKIRHFRLMSYWDDGE